MRVVLLALGLPLADVCRETYVGESSEDRQVLVLIRFLCHIGSVPMDLATLFDWQGGCDFRTDIYRQHEILAAVLSLMTYSMIQGMLANKNRIIGSEWQLGFGQVASLVALMTVFYAIFLSWQGKFLSSPPQLLGTGEGERL